MFQIINKFILNDKLTLIPMFFFSILASAFLLAQPFVIVSIFNTIKNNYLGEVGISLAAPNIPNSENFLNLEKIFLLINEYLTTLLSHYDFTGKLLTLSLFFILLCVLFSISKYLASVFTALRETNTALKIRKSLKKKVLEYDYLDFKKIQLGYFQSIFMRDTESFSIISGTFANGLFTHSFQALFIFILLISTNLNLSLIVFLIFILHFTYNKILNYPITRNTKKNYELSGQMSGTIIDYLANYKIIKLTEKQDSSYLNIFFEKFQKQDFKINRLNAIQNPARIFIDNVSIILVVLASMHFVNEKKIMVETAFLFIFFTKHAAGPISGLATTFMWWKSIYSSYFRIDQILKYKKSILSGNIKKTNFEKKIEFKNVSFSYDAHPVLNNLSFVIEKNTCTLVKGKNGSGKSTIFDLLLRLIEPKQGSICIDGIDIKELDIKSYNGIFSYVSQTNYFINGTILDNLIFGTDLKETDGDFSKLINKTLKLVDGLFAYEYPLKLKTPVGESGNFLSGGQKQKLALARSLLQKSEILILDEPTSAQDNKSTYAFRELIKEIAKYKTIIMVDHDISKFENYNIINV